MVIHIIKLSNNCVVYNYQTVLPFRPVSLYHEPPTNSSEIQSESDILKYLPGFQQSGQQIVFGAAFARPISQDPKDTSLYSLLSGTGQIPGPPVFSTDKSKCVVSQWANDTELIPKNENAYNISYGILDPKMMPSNVFI